MTGMEETLAMIFCGYPGRAGGSCEDSTRNRSSIHLECSSSVLELIPEAVSQKLVGNIHADVTAKGSQLSERTIL
jgi:hypothetical protein